MDKAAIFEEYCRVIEVDGTKDDFRGFYENHPQQDPIILQRACEEIATYVAFCMDVCTFYWSESRQGYYQYPKEDLDFSRWEVEVFHDRITINSDTDLNTVDYPNIKGLMDMHNSTLGYKGLFERLLNGESFLNKI